MQLAATSIKSVLGRGPVHPFPARMAPCVALNAFAGCGKKKLRVLDPMVGSGTSLAIAQSRGHDVVGYDIDPLAVLLSSVWLTPIDFETVADRGNSVLQRAKMIFHATSSKEAYPSSADDETKKFIRFWFDPYARRQLHALSLAISRVRCPNERAVLYAAMSRMIIVKTNGCSLAMDVSHSRPHRVYDRAPRKPFSEFSSALCKVLSGCIDIQSSGTVGEAIIQQGDARCLPLHDSSVDKIITSPPYLNAIDYMRSSKFSLVWMGFTMGGLRQLRSTSIGAEKILLSESVCDTVENCMGYVLGDTQLSARSIGVFRRYIADVYVALAEASRVLVHGGQAAYIVGDSCLSGVYVPNSSVVEYLSPVCGMFVANRAVRDIPANRRYLPPPKSDDSGSALNARMKQEVVLQLVKR